MLASALLAIVLMGTVYLKLCVESVLIPGPQVKDESFMEQIFSFAVTEVLS